MRSLMIRLLRWFRRILRRLFGQCVGASVISQTDEFGGPFFPDTLVPITTTSFVFTDLGALVFEDPDNDPQTPAQAVRVSRLRIMDITKDPPIFPFGNEAGVFDLVRDEPGSGDIFGLRHTRAPGGTVISSQVVRCNIIGTTVSTVADIGRPIFALAAAGNGVFVLIAPPLGGGNITPFRLTPGGTPQPLWNPLDAGIFPKCLAVNDGRVFVGGFRSQGGPSPAVILSVPLSGGGPGSIRQVAELGTEPQAMVFLGSDLVVASRAILAQDSSTAHLSEPSHLFRLSLTAAGIEQSREDIPVDLQGGDDFINVLDLKTLDGQLFAVDSLTRSAAPSSGAGRILRICPG